MPAPLGKVPTRKMPKIDVLGLEDSRSTRAAVRFFRERRIVVQFVDLAKRPIDAAELRRLLDRLGAAALLVDPPPDGVADRGALLARVRADPSVLRLPLVRHGDEVTAGPDEATWSAWLAGRQGGGRGAGGGGAGRAAAMPRGAGGRGGGGPGSGGSGSGGSGAGGRGAG
jgi:arsenate reductase